MISKGYTLKTMVLRYIVLEQIKITKKQTNNYTDNYM